MSVRSIVLCFLSLTAVLWAQEPGESLLSEELEQPEQFYDDEGKLIVPEPEMLPEMDEEDWAAILEGKLLPGEALMGRTALEQLFSVSDEKIIIEPEVLELLEIEDDDELWPVEIKDIHSDTYFEKPASSFLIDPQILLTERDFNEREGFLRYHAQESVIDLFVYVFEGKQDIPSKESPHSVLRNFFSSKGDVAVIFYHLGRPDRTQVAYSSRIHRGVSNEERQKAVDLAIEAAGEKSEAGSQLESLLLEMSRRLYAMEQKLPVVTLTNEMLEELEAARAKPEPSFFEKIPEGVKTLFATVGFLGFLGGMGFLVHRIIERGRVYEFPDAEGSSILDAPYAAGIGGVLSYASNANPPSEQRKQVTDYLQGL